MEVLQRGQERFNIYCTPCHSRVGNGPGEIVQRGYKSAANFHDQVRRSQKLGHYFYVMTNGYGAMPITRAVDAGRSLGGCRVHSRSAAKPGRDRKRCPQACRWSHWKTVTEKLGFPADFAKPWVLPPTAVQALHPDQSQGNPAMAPAASTPPPLIWKAKHPPRRKRQLTPPVARSHRARTKDGTIQMANGHHARTLPADLGAPAFLNSWRRRALHGGRGVCSPLHSARGTGTRRGSPAACLAARLHDLLRLRRWRLGRSDGAILVRRQMGTADSPTRSKP